jgi:hypothetical protein
MDQHLFSQLQHRLVAVAGEAVAPEVAEQAGQVAAALAPLLVVRLLLAAKAMQAARETSIQARLVAVAALALWA